MTTQTDPTKPIRVRVSTSIGSPVQFHTYDNAGVMTEQYDKMTAALPRLGAEVVERSETRFIIRMGPKQNYMLIQRLVVRGD